MNTKQRDLLSTQGNVENNLKQNYPLTEKEPIEGTPFTLIKLEEPGWFIVMGDHRITEPTKTKEEQIQKLETERWLIIMILIAITIKKIGVENETYKTWKENNLKEEIKNEHPTEYPRTKYDHDPLTDDITLK